MSSEILPLLVLVSAVLSIHGAYYGAVSHACLVIGKGLEGAPEGTNGFQDAITPPIATRSLAFNWAASAVLIFGVLYLFGWTYFALTLIVRVVIGIPFTLKLTRGNPRPHFIRVVFRSMAVREADYVKSGDHLRAEAMTDLLGRFSRSSFVKFL